ncbi:MAG: AAA family ATPase [Burkholderiaceae bacterium]|jgi:cobaltochelatase CobS
MNLADPQNLDKTQAKGQGLPAHDITEAAAIFGLSISIRVPVLKERSEHVPSVDAVYKFNPQVTSAILAGFAHNRRVAIQGRHGSGKSTHVEQVAARLNWPCLRLNLDGHITRPDLLGKNVITLREGKQVTDFEEGLLPWAIQQPMALILDEYDAGRPEILFVIQRLLERDGRLVMPDQNRVITPHPFFRIFATMNTVGLGNLSGLYHGTQLLNHAQLDRWNIMATLDYLQAEDEMAIVTARVPEFSSPERQSTLRQMVALAELTREGFATGELSSLMSPRTVISWAENILVFSSLDLAFALSFLNRCEEPERVIVAEYFQRCFGRELAYEKSS